MRFKQPSTDPVIEALRVLLRRRGLMRVAMDMNCCESYIEAIAYAKRPMSRFIAQKLGFEMVISWRKKES